MLFTWTLAERRFEAVDDLEAMACHVGRRLKAGGIPSTLIATPEGAYLIRIDTTSPFERLIAGWLDVRLELSGQETLVTVTRKRRRDTRDRPHLHRQPRRTAIRGASRSGSDHRAA